MDWIDTADAERSHVAPSLAARLLSSGRFAASAIEKAGLLAEESGEDIVNVLTRLGLISERELAEAFAQITNCPLAYTSDYPAEPVAAGIFNTDFLGHMRALPLFETEQEFGVAVVNPLDEAVIEALHFAAGKTVKVYVACPADLESAFGRLYGNSLDRNATDSEAHDAASVLNDDVDRLKDLASEAPVIRLVNGLITRAVEARASDIHIEPMENELRVRYRIDGVLFPVDSPPLRLGPAIISRVKIMAKLNIAERRLSQDGRIKIAIRGKDIDCRVSTTPTIHGESVVLRVLDQSQLNLDFEALGFEEHLILDFRAILNRPHGILLVTGPTGSGKTTTLYTALLELNTSERKILTIEDPVEYRLEGINQVQVKPQIGLTFPAALRSFLRQDPDIMMVGEIRDLETAQVAVQAALTGHLILSTLHTNDAASSIARLRDMGVEEYLIGATLNGIAAQRLVRTLCTKCRKPYLATPDFLQPLGINISDHAVTLYRPTGCSACGGTGFCGRTAILEILSVSESLRQAILGNRDIAEIQHVAERSGMRRMQSHGFAKALKGITSIEEVLRVTQGTAQ